MFMNVLILGGDGYLGWATAMHMSARGHNTTVIDNYLRRQLSKQINKDPLIEVPNLHSRAEIWKAASGHEVDVRIGELSDYAFLVDVVKDVMPDVIIHYAEMPSAPYSMMNQRSASLTINNNLNATLNVVYAIREHCPKCHLIKLGTMGEYGTPNIDIEEGYLDVEHNGRSHKFLYPKTPGSLYHLTKVQDSDLMYLATRIWGLAITDLNQGPVYGIETQEMEADERLAPLFNYDDVFGTVLNRFMVQAVNGDPLTVYGKGGQQRGYLNIIDTMQCVELAMKNPAPSGEFRVLNQFTEVFSVNELADRVIEAGKELGLKVQAANVENPRKEMEEHYYNPRNTGFKDLGLEAHPLTTELLVGMLKYVEKHKSAIRSEYVMPAVKW
jgi:UDP-sulfoquinovose synthase